MTAVASGAMLKSMRTGDEPSHARSPLRARLALAGFGLVFALIAAGVLAGMGHTGVALAFVAVAVLAVVDIAVVVAHLRQGPHYQPGPDVPPYRPLPAERRTAPRRESPSASTRQRRYLLLMGTCLGLLLVSWVFVRLISVPAAVVLTLIAMVIPPFAALVGNVNPFGTRPNRDATDSPTHDDGK
jgi:Family of unknown function (DUF6343)/Protein of unknown function (DUF3099)